MRWLAFFILTYVVLGLQLGLGEFVTYRGAMPNLALIAVVFIAGNAPRDSALLGAFLIGLFQDLLTAQPIGLYALSYGISGIAIVGSRGFANSEHPLTHVLLTLLSGLVSATVLSIHWLIRRPGQPITLDGGTVLPGIGFAPGALFLSAILTAALSPFVLWIMTRLKPLFGFRASRRRYR